MALNNLQSKDRKAALNLLKKMRSSVQKTYIEASDELAKEIRKLRKINGFPDKTDTLTIKSKIALQESLNTERKKLRARLDKAIRSGTAQVIDNSVSSKSRFTTKYLAEYSTLDRAIVNDTFAKVNADLLEIQFAKTYGKGLKYSNRIWKSSKLFERDIRNVISEGLARNRDITVIAEDIQKYVREGKQTLTKRYGNLDQSPRRPGETEAEYKRRVRKFKSRISGNIEYNSLRIARTQIQGAIQDSDIASQSYTPSVQAFNWNLSPAHKVYSICEDIVAGNPWIYENWFYSTPPHPNCLSYVTYIEKSEKQFISDLKAWTNNPNATGTEYLSDWKEKYYSPVSRGQVDNNYFTRLLEINERQKASLKRRVA